MTKNKEGNAEIRDTFDRANVIYERWRINS